jgi:catechol 2,3-dioxygenase
MEGIDIVRASHIEYVVSNLEDARRYYVDMLGFIETESAGKTIYLRGIEDRIHHCLVLTEGEKPALDHMAFSLRTGKDIGKAKRFLDSEGIDFIAEDGAEKGLGETIRFQDPFGFPVELFYDTEKVDWKLQQFDAYRGGRIMRIDHFNIITPDVPSAVEWYTGRLNFILSEYTEDEDGAVQSAWLRRKYSSHDLAIMRGPGPRFHHAGFTVSDRNSILDCADIMASRGHTANIERGPGRHGITNAFFLYLRDADRHRIELYTGDYMAADPELPAVRWHIGDPRRQTFWGTPAPESWQREASAVSQTAGRSGRRTRG